MRFWKKQRSTPRPPIEATRCTLKVVCPDGRVLEWNVRPTWVNGSGWRLDFVSADDYRLSASIAEGTFTIDLTQGGEGS